MRPLFGWPMVIPSALWLTSASVPPACSLGGADRGLAACGSAAELEKSTLEDRVSLEEPEVSGLVQLKHHSGSRRRRAPAPPPAPPMYCGGTNTDCCQCLTAFPSSPGVAVFIDGDGPGLPGSNQYICTNGTEAYCPSYAACFQTLPWPGADLAAGCFQASSLPYQNSNLCQCVSPMAGSTSPGNGYVCSPGNEFSCGDGSWCFNAHQWYSNISDVSAGCSAGYITQGTGQCSILTGSAIAVGTAVFAFDRKVCERQCTTNILCTGYAYPIAGDCVLYQQEGLDLSGSANSAGDGHCYVKNGTSGTKQSITRSQRHGSPDSICTCDGYKKAEQYASWFTCDDGTSNECPQAETCQSTRTFVKSDFAAVCSSQPHCECDSMANGGGGGCGMNPYYPQSNFSCPVDEHCSSLMPFPQGMNPCSTGNIAYCDRPDSVSARHVLAVQELPEAQTFFSDAVVTHVLVAGGFNACGGQTSDWTLATLNDMYPAPWYVDPTYGAGVCYVGNNGGAKACAKLCAAIDGCNFFSTSTTEDCYACFVYPSCSSPIQVSPYEYSVYQLKTDGMANKIGYRQLSGDCPGNNIQVFADTGMTCVEKCNSDRLCRGFSEDATSCITKSAQCSVPTDDGWIFYAKIPAGYEVVYQKIELDETKNWAPFPDGAVKISTGSRRQVVGRKSPHRFCMTTNVTAYPQCADCPGGEKCYGNVAVHLGPYVFAPPMAYDDTAGPAGQLGEGSMAEAAPMLCFSPPGPCFCSAPFSSPGFFCNSGQTGSCPSGTSCISTSGFYVNTSGFIVNTGIPAPCGQTRADEARAGLSEDDAQARAQEALSAARAKGGKKMDPIMKKLARNVLKQLKPRLGGRWNALKLKVRSLEDFLALRKRTWELKVHSKANRTRSGRVEGNRMRVEEEDLGVEGSLPVQQDPQLNSNKPGSWQINGGDVGGGSSKVGVDKSSSKLSNFTDGWLDPSFEASISYIPSMQVTAYPPLFCLSFDPFSITFELGLKYDDWKHMSKTSYAKGVPFLSRSFYPGKNNNEHAFDLAEEMSLNPLNSLKIRGIRARVTVGLHADIGVDGQVVISLGVFMDVIPKYCTAVSQAHGEEDGAGTGTHPAADAAGEHAATSAAAILQRDTRVSKARGCDCDKGDDEDDEDEDEDPEEEHHDEEEEDDEAEQQESESAEVNSGAEEGEEAEESSSELGEDIAADDSVTTIVEGTEAGNAVADSDGVAEVAPDASEAAATSEGVEGADATAEVAADAAGEAAGDAGLEIGLDVGLDCLLL
ncbi:unnamed protein product [Polarella glacialis]|uniref:Uncharacterized protein n=1 Tax=Polarella glacialis TaxID=89957 RepID=A0A813E982_POLGL|nr:unnamed protein product [Polarella glacialis]